MRIVRLLVTTLLLVAACTGSPSRKSTANDFVDAACPDLAAFATSVNRAFTELQRLGQVAAAGDATAQEGLLRNLSTSLGDVDKATSQLANGISSRGAPNIASGDDIKKSILDSLNRLRDVLNRSRQEVDSFDVRTATKEQSDKLKSDLEGLSTEVANAFSGLAPLNQNNDLKAAFAGSANCKQVGSGFSS